MRGIRGHNSWWHFRNGATFVMAASAFLLLAFTSNATPPHTPTIKEPASEGEIVHPADVHMETSAFSDPDAGDTHQCTDLNIYETSATATTLAWAATCISGPEAVHAHLGDGSFKNSYVGRTELLFDADYELRIRHRDNNNEYSGYTTRTFRTSSPTEVFPMETEDAEDTPTPTWADEDDVAISIPTNSPPAFMRVETVTSNLFVEFNGVTGLSNAPAISDHEVVRVRIASGGQTWNLPVSTVTFTTDEGEQEIYLPSLSLASNEVRYFWISENGSSYVATGDQTEPDFSTLAQGAPVPWTVRQPGYKVEIFASGFQLPVHLAFVPNPGSKTNDPYFYVTELYGQVKVVTRDGTVLDYATGLLNFNPTGNFPGSGEQGVAGIAVDPATTNVFVSLLYESTDSGNPHYPRVIRLDSTDGGLTASSTNTILDMDGETMGQSHQISDLSIGPDDKLYVHMGDGFDSTTATNITSYRGKVLRVNLDGSAPTDNPLYNAGDGINATDYMYARGFRNPFGGGWRDADTNHYEVENGPTIDRLARVLSGANYRWDGDDLDMTNSAAYNWFGAHAPVDLAFIQSGDFSGSGFPAEKMDHAFVTESGPTYASGPQVKGKRVVEFVLDQDGNRVSGPSALVEYSGSGKASASGITAGPDGLYFADLYKDLNTSAATNRGANVLRIKFVGAADFDVHPVYSATAPLVVNFTNMSTVVNPTSWLWDFGDGTTNTNEHPAAHSYTNAGFFDVQLQVTSSNGVFIERKHGYVYVGDTPSSLTGHYRLDETSGTTTIDSSTNGNDGVYQGGPALAQEGAHFSTATAVDFDAVNDYSSLSNASVYGFQGDFTASAWINLDDVSGDQAIIGTDGYANDVGLHLIVRDGNAHLGFFGNDTTGTVTIDPNQWYHVVWRFKDGEQAVFVDSLLDTADTGHANFAGNDPVLIGRWGNDSGTPKYANGRIDDVQIYNRGLTTNEIDFLFNNPGQILLLPEINNDAGASNVTRTIAYLNGELVFAPSDSEGDVRVYYGRTDGGTTQTNWDGYVSLGAAGAGALSTLVSGLVADATYYYRYYAENSAGANWSESSASFETVFDPFDHPQKMTIQFCGYDKGETLTNFPALIVLNTNLTGFDYFDFASPVGSDLRFSDESTNELNYEIERWNTNGVSFVWVQVPQLTNTNSVVVAYWGNTNIVGDVAKPDAISDLELWVKADSGVQTNASGGVTNWVDQTDNVRDASQGTSAEQPSFVGNYLNGLPVVRFDGENDELSYDGSFLVGTDYSIFIVEGRSSGQAENWFLGGTGSSANQNLHVGSYLADDDYGHHHWGNDYQAHIGNFTGQVFRVVSVHLDSSGGNGRSLYLNGTIAASSTDNTQLSAYPGAMIGAMLAGNGTNYQGDIAEVVFYDRALSDTERNQVGFYLAQKYGLPTAHTDPKAPTYTSDGSTWSAGFVSVLHLDEDEVTYLDSASTNDGTMVDASGNTIRDATGQVGGAVDFSGGADYIEVDNESNFDINPEITFSAWFRVDAFDTAFQAMTAKGEGNSWRMARNSSTDQLEWNAGPENVIPTRSVNDGSLHQVVGTRDGSSIDVYIDGRREATAATSGSITGTGDKLRVGENPGATGRGWEGILDEIRVSDVSRSSNWVWAAYMTMASNTLFTCYDPVKNPPAATNYVVNTSNVVTDAQVLNGTYSVEIDLVADEGLVTNATLPSVDVRNSSAVTIVTNATFSNHVFGATSLKASNAVMPATTSGGIGLGTFSLTWSAQGSNGLAVSDATLLSNGAALSFTVVDDDTNGPVTSGFNVDANILTNSALGGGLYITGLVQDAESGVYAANHTYLLVRGCETVSSGLFTNTPASDGDAQISPGPLGVTIAASVITNEGAYYLYVSNVSYDVDRPDDSQTGGSVYTFLVKHTNKAVLANVLTNEGFESGSGTAFVNWTNVGSAFRETAVSRNGSYAGKLFGNFVDNTNTAALYQDFATTKDEIWQLSAWALTPNFDAIQGDSYGDIRIEFFDADTNMLLDAPSAHRLTSSSSLDEWHYLSVIAAAPEDAAFARPAVAFVQISSNDTGSAWFDDVEFGRLPVPKISFAGEEWQVRNYYGGPGPNYWSTDNVYVDTNGSLHLQIQDICGAWFSAEVLSTQTYGYGEYRWYLESAVDLLDSNAVGGLFTYQEPSDTFTNEIDIEFSRALTGTAVSNLQFAIQPAGGPGNLFQAPMTLTNILTTHRFTWSATQVVFMSYYGHTPIPPTGFMIESWTNTGGDIPTTSLEKVHMNLWLKDGNDPLGSGPTNLDMVITDFTFTPLAVDSDGDGLPDDWENAQFGNLSRDGAGDFDGDGLDDRFEYQAGSAPTNASSKLEWVDVNVSSTGVGALTWESDQDGQTAERTYVVHFSDGPYSNASAWNVLQAGIPTAGLNTTISNDVNSASVTLRLYRILVDGYTNARTRDMYAVQVHTLPEDRSFIGVPIVPDAATVAGVLTTNYLPSATTESDASVVDFWDQDNQTLTNRYWHSSASGFEGWRDQSFNPVNNTNINLDKGLIITIRIGQGDQKLYLFGRVPTNGQTQAVYSNGYTLAVSTYPSSIPLGQSQLVEGGFTGGDNLVTSDNLLFFDPQAQLFSTKVWYYTGDGTWRNADASLATNHIEPGEAVLIRRRNRTTQMVWTNAIPYDVPLQGP